MHFRFPRVLAKPVHKGQGQIHKIEGRNQAEFSYIPNWKPRKKLKILINKNKKS